MSLTVAVMCRSPTFGRAFVIKLVLLAVWNNGVTVRGQCDVTARRRGGCDGVKARVVPSSSDDAVYFLCCVADT